MVTKQEALLLGKNKTRKEGGSCGPKQQQEIHPLKKIPTYSCVTLG